MNILATTARSEGRPVLRRIGVIVCGCALLGACAAALERHRSETRANLLWQAAFDLECEDILLTPLAVRPNELITRYEVEGCGRSASYVLIPATRFGDWIDEADTEAVEEARRAERQADRENDITESVFHRQTIRESRRY